MAEPRSLILNRATECPSRHWLDDDGRLVERPGRRPAGYEIFDVRNNTRRTEPLDLVNRIRERVDAWRAADYPGVTTVTRRLLAHWHDASAREYAFYFCQLEAVETLIWHVEALPEYRQGIHVPGDGGPFERLCSKMATGTGKTLVMAMIITWQVLNALTYPRRNRDFSRAAFVVAPGLTVKERLQVLLPGHPANAYDEFALCPNEALRQRLNRARVKIENWHTLMPAKEPDRSVVRKGPETDEAFTRRVLGELAEERDLIVLNDEAHHAYRRTAHEKNTKRQAKEARELGLDPEQATRWIEGLDRIHATRRIRRCFDLTATPFAPTGMASTEKGLFEWIVSDFGLNDAIEAGLVKTPRVVVRDGVVPDTRTLRPKLYHLYRDPSVQEDLNRRAEPHEALPELVQHAYTLLGADWRAALRDWQEAGHESPPVMLTVCNRIETARRVEHYFTAGDAHWSELHDPTRLLRVDSKVLEKAEVGDRSTADKDYEAHLHAIVEALDLPPDRREQLLGRTKEELLRAIVDNVGKRGTAGQGLQKVISVAMLSEGWDAKNVTHILGLRAFTSQLLCEQVIGRGLRRVSHDVDEDGYFLPEYVNVFGVPLSIFQDVGAGGEAPPPPKRSTQIESLPERNAFELRWPNVLRVDAIVRPQLQVDWSAVDPLVLDPARIPIRAEIAPALGGASDLGKVTEIDLSKLPEDFRLQRSMFRAARKLFEGLSGQFRGNEDVLIVQLVRLVEAFADSDKLVIPSDFHSDPARRRVLLALQTDEIVQHIGRHLEEQNAEHLEPVFDEDAPIGSTREMRTWYTTKAVRLSEHSQISHAVIDSAWEALAAEVLDSHPQVDAWAKNDHLNFHIHYLWKGSRRRYVPDFLVRLRGGRMLVLEIKGQDDEQNRAKRAAMATWVAAVNARGGFGVWACDVVFEMGRMRDVLDRHAAAQAA
jgi:type III restriction enzyme